MDCPKCGKGKIRVVAGIACTCGHYPFVCDGCAQHFSVPHSSASGALPPDVSLEEDEEHRTGYEELMKFIGNENPQPYEEIVLAAIAAEPNEFPLLEDFRKANASS